MSGYVSNADLALVREVLRLADDLGDLRDHGTRDPAVRNTLDVGRELLLTVARDRLGGNPE